MFNDDMKVSSELMNQQQQVFVELLPFVGWALNFRIFWFQRASNWPNRKSLLKQCKQLHLVIFEITFYELHNFEFIQLLFYSLFKFYFSTKQFTRPTDKLEIWAATKFTLGKFSALAVVRLSGWKCYLKRWERKCLIRSLNKIFTWIFTSYELRCKDIVRNWRTN